ncbi:hypothetical protein [Bacillus gobiensis]|uniref:hypothetical protein n=1 Tax=Bacillus gobiensis TaxID=1441095 RepID=UPI003D1CDCDC
MMQTMYELVVHRRFERLLGGGRIPLYHQVKDTMTKISFFQHCVKYSLLFPPESMS